MCSILLSINPIHVEQIMNGNKLYEFRKNPCKRHVDKIIIYSTFPIKKVVGEADVEEVLIDTPENLWKKTKDYAGIDKKFFDEYYQDRERAVAYKIKMVTPYSQPRDLDEYGIKCAPQSYQYI